MAPRRPLAREAWGLNTPPKSGGGSAEGTPAGLTYSLGSPLVATPASDIGSAGGGEPGRAVYAGLGAHAPPPVGSADTDKLQAALAELRAASSARDEASAGRRAAAAERREAAAERWEASQGSAQAAAVEELEELRREVEWLRHAEDQQQRTSELLQLLSGAGPPGADLHQGVLEAPSCPRAADAACLEALRLAQQSCSSLAGDAPERLRELEGLRAAAAEGAERGYEQALSVEAALSEARGQLQEEAEQQAEAARLAAETQRLVEEESEVARRMAEAKHRKSTELKAVKREARELRAELECEQRSRLQTQECLKAEQQAAGRLQQEARQLHSELSAQSGACWCTERPNELRAGLASLSPVQLGAPCRTAPAVLSATARQLPIQVGVSTVADLLKLMFGDIQRPLEASDLEAFSADALALLARGHEGPQEVPMDGGDDDEDGAVAVELDPTMEWMMTADNDPQVWLDLGVAELYQAEPPSPSGSDERPWHDELAEDGSDVEVEWDADAASDCASAAADVFEPVVARLMADMGALCAEAVCRRGRGAPADAGIELEAKAPLERDVRALNVDPGGGERKAPAGAAGTLCGEEEDMSADTGAGLEGGASPEPDGEASDGTQCGTEEIASAGVSAELEGDAEAVEPGLCNERGFSPSSEEVIELECAQRLVRTSRGEEEVTSSSENVDALEDATFLKPTTGALGEALSSGEEGSGEAVSGEEGSSEEGSSDEGASGISELEDMAALLEAEAEAALEASHNQGEGTPASALQEIDADAPLQHGAGAAEERHPRDGEEGGVPPNAIPEGSELAESPGGEEVVPPAAGAERLEEGVPPAAGVQRLEVVESPRGEEGVPPAGGVERLAAVEPPAVEEALPPAARAERLEAVQSPGGDEGAPLGAGADRLEDAELPASAAEDVHGTQPLDRQEDASRSGSADVGRVPRPESGAPGAAARTAGEGERADAVGELKAEAECGQAAAVAPQGSPPVPLAQSEAGQPVPLCSAAPLPPDSAAQQVQPAVPSEARDDASGESDSASSPPGEGDPLFDFEELAEIPLDEAQARERANAATKGVELAGEPWTRKVSGDPHEVTTEVMTAKEVAAASSSARMDSKTIQASSSILGQLWRVVGGIDLGGIRVREGQSMSTRFLNKRLSTDSIIAELELHGERLSYMLVEGEGPSTGWVTVRVPGKELCVRVEAAQRQEPLEPVVVEPAEPEVEPDASTSLKPRADTARAPETYNLSQVKEEFEAYQREFCSGSPWREAFMAALGRREARVVRRLLLQKAPVDMADELQRTPLLKAVRWMSEPLCRLLLVFSANPRWPPQRSAAEEAATLKQDRRNSPVPALFEPDQVRRLRQEAIHDAALAGEAEVIQVLAANGRFTMRGRMEVEEDMCSLDADGWTPLHLCVLAGNRIEHQRTLSTLLKERASIDVPDGRGETPLMLAVRHAKDTSVCYGLLKARADMWCRNPIGETALDLATQGEEAIEDVSQLLMDRAREEWWSEADLHILCKEPPLQGLDVRVPRLHLPIKHLPMPWPKVSVVCPTVPSRSRFHHQVYRCFDQQTYPEKELVVVDSGPESSSFFSSGGPGALDKRVVYRYRRDQDAYDPKRPEDGHGALSVGSKRNIGIRAATGSIIAHFDDDDFYGPGYLEQMVSMIIRHGAHAVKLSSFFVFDCQSGRLGYCDPESDRCSRDDTSMEEFILGYGFSYVYKKELAEKKPFPNLHFGEDYAFLMGLQQAGYSVCLWPDLDGICLHMQHGRNTSNAFCSDNVPRSVLPSMEISGCRLLEETLDQYTEMLDDGRQLVSVVPSEQQHLRKSAMLSLALQVLDCRGRIAAQGAGSVPSGGLGPRVVEARALLDRALDSISPAAQLHREHKLELVSETGASTFNVLVPWCATIGEVRHAALGVLRTRAGSRLTIRDAQRDLTDAELLLGRRSVRYAID